MLHDSVWNDLQVVVGHKVQPFHRRLHAEAQLSKPRISTCVTAREQCSWPGAAGNSRRTGAGADARRSFNVVLTSEQSIVAGSGLLAVLQPTR